MVGHQENGEIWCCLKSIIWKKKTYLRLTDTKQQYYACVHMNVPGFILLLFLFLNTNIYKSVRLETFVTITMEFFQTLSNMKCLKSMNLDLCLDSLLKIYKITRKQSITWVRELWWLYRQMFKGFSCYWPANVRLKSYSR